MESKRCIQGRWLSEADIRWVRNFIKLRPDWSRKRLAKGLCHEWDWRNGRGRLKDFAARSLLLKLKAEGRIELPALQEDKRRERRKVAWLAQWQQPPVLEIALAQLRPLQVSLVEPGTQAWKEWAFYLHHFHYLELRIVGENVGYLVKDAQGRDVACLLFGAAAWKCSVRDQFLGWEQNQRPEQLTRIANNTRLLILPWVRVKSLASHALALVCRRINRDWRQKYGHGLDWLETFVEVGRFQGSCYAAASWQLIGKTQGRGRQDRQHQGMVAPKEVYLYRLN